MLSWSQKNSKIHEREHWGLDKHLWGFSQEFLIGVRRRTRVGWFSAYRSGFLISKKNTLLLSWEKYFLQISNVRKRNLGNIFSKCWRTSTRCIASKPNKSKPNKRSLIWISWNFLMKKIIEFRQKTENVLN